MHSEVIMNFKRLSENNVARLLAAWQGWCKRGKTTSGLPHLPVRVTAAVRTPITCDAVTQPLLPVKKSN